MGFWDRQVEELTGSIAGVLAGGAPGSRTADLAGMASEAAYRFGDHGAAGEGVSAVDAAGDALRQGHSALTDADQQLEALLGAVHESASSGHAELSRIQDDVANGFAALGPSMDTPAGQEQLLDLLLLKVTQVQGLLGSGLEASAGAALQLDAIGRGYLADG